MKTKRPQLVETDEIGFDADGFAIHKPCGERVTEEWSITRTESYNLKRDGTAVITSEGGDDKECDGAWCDGCDTQVKIQKE